MRAQGFTVVRSFHLVEIILEPSFCQSFFRKADEWLRFWLRFGSQKIFSALSLQFVDSYSRGAFVLQNQYDTHYNHGDCTRPAIQ